MKNKYQIIIAAVAFFGIGTTDAFAHQEDDEAYCCCYSECLQGIEQPCAKSCDAYPSSDKCAQHQSEYGGFGKSWTWAPKKSCSVPVGK